MRFPELDPAQLRTLVIGGSCMFAPLAIGTLLGATFPAFLAAGTALGGACLLAAVGRPGSAPHVHPPHPVGAHGGDALHACTEHFIAREFAAAQRGRDLTLVMFGFSRFEEFTAREGSAAAAEALQAFGQVLQRMTRQMNLSARYGWRADSFLSVLSQADTQGAEAFIRRVRAAAAQLTLRMPEVEVGVATYRPGVETPEQLVRLAEDALAAARASGVRMAARRADGIISATARIQVA